MSHFVLLPGLWECLNFTTTLLTVVDATEEEDKSFANLISNNGISSCFLMSQTCFLRFFLLLVSFLLQTV